MNRDVSTNISRQQISGQIGQLDVHNLNGSCADVVHAGCRVIKRGPTDSLLVPSWTEANKEA